MKQAQAQFNVRIARPSDFRAIARLCRRAVGPRDYVLLFLKEAIRDKGLFLAWNGQELVGMTNFEKCIDGSGWLSMARTDPAWRRMGVAVFLQKAIAAHAKPRGVTFLRLWTSSTNKPSQYALKKGGFRKVCDAAQVQYSVRKKVKKQTISPTKLSRPELKSLLNSTYVSKMNGYLAYKWHFVRAKETIPKLVRRAEVYRTGESIFVLTRTERAVRRIGLSIALLSGPVRASLMDSRKIAGLLGGQVLRAYVPYDRHMLSVAKSLGFSRPRWGRHCLVFERRIS
jgi:GNAT superfamily N-acetyltransferase